MDKELKNKIKLAVHDAAMAQRFEGRTIATTRENLVAALERILDPVLARPNPHPTEDTLPAAIIHAVRQAQVWQERGLVESEALGPAVLALTRDRCPSAFAHKPESVKGSVKEPVQDLAQEVRALTQAVEKLEKPTPKHPDSVFESVCFKTAIRTQPGLDWDMRPVEHHYKVASMIAVQTRVPNACPVDAVRWNGTWYEKSGPGNAEYFEKEYEQQ